MNKTILLSLASCFSVLALSACTVAKLEARLEANPQCKDVVNPKTGAVMPCPGTDRAFYVAAGLEEPRKPKAVPVAAAPIDTGTSSSAPAASNSVAKPSPTSAASTTPTSQADCKPKLHQKTGGMLPCPPLE
jgi:hypothetical protein